jgi:hypothetical protein
MADAKPAAKAAAKGNKNIMIIGLIIVVVIIAGVILFGAKSGGSLGSGAPYVSQSQAQSLFGAGGAYNHSAATNASAITALIGSIQTPSKYANNVTAAWKVEYIDNTTHTGMFEIILQMNNARAQSLYAQALNSSSQAFSIDNATVNGMVYSAQKFADTAGIIGYKNSDLVLVFMNDSGISIQNVASVVASDLP